MTLGARRDWYIRLQCAQRFRFRDVDVAGRTLRDMQLLLATTFVRKLRGDPHGLGEGVWSSRELVTAIAVCGDGFLRLPMTVET